MSDVIDRSPKVAKELRSLRSQDWNQRSRINIMRSGSWKIEMINESRRSHIGRSENNYAMRHKKS
jgi:hypothetical protein